MPILAYSQNHAGASKRAYVGGGVVLALTFLAVALILAKGSGFHHVLQTLKHHKIAVIATASALLGVGVITAIAKTCLKVRAANRLKALYSPAPGQSSQVSYQAPRIVKGDLNKPDPTTLELLGQRENVYTIRQDKFIPQEQKLPTLINQASIVKGASDTLYMNQDDQTNPYVIITRQNGERVVYYITEMLGTSDIQVDKIIDNNAS